MNDFLDLRANFEIFHFIDLNCERVIVLPLDEGLLISCSTGRGRGACGR